MRQISSSGDESSDGGGDDLVGGSVAQPDLTTSGLRREGEGRSGLQW
jgi:hypothetical protein